MYNTTNIIQWAHYPVLPEAGVEYFVGLDLGQAQDYTAVAILEKREIVLRERDPVTWELQKQTSHMVRDIKRAPLHTPYTEIVDRVERLVRSPALYGRTTLVVDATGVGRGVLDLIRRARLACEVVPVTITAGDQARHEKGMWRVPKRDLIGDLQLMLESDELGVADCVEEASALIKEMRSMQVRIGPTGHDQIGTWRESQHDDLVFAVALAAWNSRTRRPTWGKHRIL